MRRLIIALVALSVLAILWRELSDTVDDAGVSSVAARIDASRTDPQVAARVSAGPESDVTEAGLPGDSDSVCALDAQAQTGQAMDQTYEQMLQSASEYLAASQSADHLLAAALLEVDAESQLALIERGLALNSTDPFLLWTAVRICSDSNDALDCPLREWEQRLIAVDGQNSESWVLVAWNRYAAGEISAALEAMQFASTSAETRIYWPDTMELVERELRAVSNFSFPERAENAFGVAGSELPSPAGLTTMCEQQSAVDPDWAYTCLRYGERAESQSRTLLGISIAGLVQRQVYEATGEPERAAEVAERVKAVRQRLVDSNDPRVMELITTNPGVFGTYIAALKSVGEIDAKAHIAPDIEHLVSQCDMPEPARNSRPEWVTTRDRTEVEAIYAELRQLGSQGSRGLERVERRTGLDERTLEVILAFGDQVYQDDLRHEIAAMESLCDARAPMTREALLPRLQSMQEDAQKIQENAVNELFRRLTFQAAAAVRTAYAPETRSWTSQTTDTDLAAMVKEVEPAEMRDSACSELAATRRQQQQQPVSEP